MVFKINISDKGKTIKIETESEALIRNKIGDVIKGESFSPDLEGYELEITGTSDASGFPGIKGQQGNQLRRVLLTKKDKAMKTKRPKGLRLRKSVRGEEISEKTSQINMAVKKQGNKKFEEMLPKKEGEEVKSEVPKEEAKPAEKPAEQAPQDQEPKTSEQTIKQEVAPDQEPKATEQEKAELSNPDEEPKK